MVEGYNDRPLVKKVSTKSMVEGKQYEHKLALGSDASDVSDNSERNIQRIRKR